MLSEIPPLSAEKISLYSQLIRQELERLRAIDPDLPFAVLTILVGHELSLPETPALTSTE